MRHPRFFNQSQCLVYRVGIARKIGPRPGDEPVEFSRVSKPEQLPVGLYPAQRFEQLLQFLIGHFSTLLRNKITVPVIPAASNI